jgi:hypothetical protein
MTSQTTELVTSIIAACTLRRSNWNLRGPRREAPMSDRHDVVDFSAVTKAHQQTWASGDFLILAIAIMWPNSSSHP